MRVIRHVFILFFLLSITVVISLAIGTTHYTYRTIIDSFISFDATNTEHLIIQHGRAPRVYGALLVGAWIAVSGALMQGVTRNYLASPSIMGVTDGSILVITLLVILYPNAHPITFIICSFIGSLMSVYIVSHIARKSAIGTNPITLAIIGTIVGMFLSGFAQMLATYFQISQTISFWYNTRLHQLDITYLYWTFPIGFIGLCLAFYLSRYIAAIALGEDVAQSLGIRLNLVHSLTFFSVALLTGVSVALVGKVTFIGLVVPHITRFLVGEDYKKIIPYSALLGGLFFAWSDIVSRVLNPPFEVPVGVVTALIGVPYFLYLIRTQGRKQYVH